MISKPYTFNGYTVPNITQLAMDRFIHKKIPTGDFLQGVLSNNLIKAISYGDIENIKNLSAIVCYMINNAPAICWGTSNKYHAWIQPKSKK